MGNKDCQLFLIFRWNVILGEFSFFLWRVMEKVNFPINFPDGLKYWRDAVPEIGQDFLD
jgi:hypothetical protein